MRILHVIGGSEFGGGSKVILDLVAMGNCFGWKSSVLTTNKEFHKHLRAAGADTIALDLIKRPIRPIRDALDSLALRQFLKENRYDIVHTHTTKGGLIGRWAATAANTPAVIHTVHGFAFHEASPWLKVIFYALIEKIAASWCDQIVTVSEYHRDWAVRLRLHTRRPIRAIPNGVSSPCISSDRKLQRSKMRESLGIPSDTFLFFNHGRIVHEKGIEDLLQAVASIVRIPNNRKFVLAIAGKGELLDYFRARASDLGLGGTVKFLGFRGDIPALLSASDAVVLPSVREGLSIALLEALEAGKPVIATSIGSNVEVISKLRCGLLVRCNDPDGLRIEMQRVLDDDELRRRLGELARRTYLQFYTVERMMEEYADLYLQLTKGKCGEAARVCPPRTAAPENRAPIGS